MPALTPADPAPVAHWPLLASSVLAAAVPTLVAFNQPPSATLLNQCLAVALWGGVAVLLPPGRWVRGTGPLLAALVLVAAGAAGSCGWGGLPLSLALQALGLLAAAAVMVLTGANAARPVIPTGPPLAAAAHRPDAAQVFAARTFAAQTFAALAAGLLIAGLLGAAVAGVQVFMPSWADGQWIAVSGLPGRAVGNLRQPNHLGSLLLWALVAAVALHELRWLSRAALWSVALPLVLAVELTASRTGAVGLGLLLLWALVDRRLSPTARWLLAATPVLYAVAYLAMGWYGDFSQHALGAGARMAAEGGLGDLAQSGDSPNSRLNIWRNALSLIAAQPWAGVGFGEFNFAWTLSAFAHRPTAFFDHTHNLALQLAVELGLPAALGVLGLLLLAAWQVLQQARRATGSDGLIARSGGLLVLIALLHSAVEYPLWYAYFLLPTALVWGFVLGLPSARVSPAGAGVPSPTGSAHPPDPRPAGPHRRPWGLLAGVLMTAAGAWALLDYQRAVVIYAPVAGSGSLAERIEQGQRSLLFAHHADYAAATNTTSPASAELGFERAPHALLDTRLMMAWAQHLADRGETDKARWLAQRLREFRNLEAAPFFAPCDAGNSSAFQCQTPLAVHGWREFLVPAPGIPARLAPAGRAQAAASSASQ